MIHLDSLALISIVSFVVLWLVVAAAAPKRDWEGHGRSTLGLVLAGTLLAYSAATLPVFLAGWTLTVSPYLLCWPGRAPRTRIILGLSTLLLAAGAALTAAWPAGEAAPYAFALLMGATLLRKGIFPFHFWIVETFEQTALPPLSLLLDSHLGAYLLIRFTIPLAPETASAALPYLSFAALFTSVYMAVAALGETLPRRVLGLLCISQASFILAGLENRTQQGITGALLQWWVVAFAMTGMVAIFAALEARNTAVTSPNGYLGLGAHAPRLAGFFAISGLALVGLPGTLGFVAEDLLFHGALSAHSMLGLALPLATALNAITVVRLFTVLFLGRRAIHATPITDARPRETLALAATVLVLVLGGLLPGVLIELRTPSAASLTGLLSGVR